MTLPLVVSLNKKLRKNFVEIVIRCSLFVVREGRGPNGPLFFYWDFAQADFMEPRTNGIMMVRVLRKDKILIANG